MKCAEEGLFSSLMLMSRCHYGALHACFVFTSDSNLMAVYYFLMTFLKRLLLWGYLTSEPPLCV